MTPISLRFKDWVKRHDVKVGTKVKVLRVWYLGEKGCDPNLTRDKEAAIGNIYTIGRLHPAHGDVSLEGFRDYNCIFPYFVLKVIDGA
jgi:hypothetical protein